MKPIRLHHILSCILLAICYNAGAQTMYLPQLGKNSISEVISAMTLEEKVKLLVGKGMNLPGLATDAPVIGSTQDKVPGAAGTTYEISRLGIPSLVLADGPAGVRIDSVREGKPGKTYYATGWPVATLLASTWDTTLVKKVGTAFGGEAKDYEVDIILAPGMNIHRNPLGGRNFEYYSEDPLLTGKMAAAMVNGLQSNGIGTSIKHFAANNQETNRFTVNTIVSERALREIYLKGFELAVKNAQPWTVMSSYNLLNGTYTSENHDLLSTILRKEWGFKGFVMTDWFGGKDPVAQMNAGNNMLMPGTQDQMKKITEAVQSGALSEKVLDENITGILNIVLHAPSFKKVPTSDKPELQQNAQLARQAAAEGMVLLRNEHNTLPLKQSKGNVALFGINGYELIAGGTGSGDVNKAYKISLAEGLIRAGFKVDAGVQDTYANYLREQAAQRPKKSFFEEFQNPTPPIPEYAVAKKWIDKKAVSTDLAIIAIGRNAGEQRDRGLEGDFLLTSIEKDLIKNVTEAFHAQNKKVVVVLNIGGIIEMQSWIHEVDAILLAWQPGQEGGNAMADILSGKVNPSGKLASTFPIAYNDVPSAQNFPGKEFPEQAYTGALGLKTTPAEVIYEEGIYVGYRYYNTFKVKPAFEFGYGLSYTDFEYSAPKLSATTFTGTLNVRVTVTNKGKFAGKEVVQLYLSAPALKLNKPEEELRGFAKTNLLQPGQSQTLSFTLSASDLASFDAGQSAWIAEPGKYNIKIGASSQNIKQTATFHLSKEIVVEKTNKAVIPQVKIKEQYAKNTQ